MKLRARKYVIYHSTRILYTHPRLGRLVRELRFKVWMLLITVRSSKDLKINKIIWVDPKKICYVLRDTRGRKLHSKFNIGNVFDGDWDKSLIRFEDSDVYQAFRKRFIYKEEWNTTDYYKNILSGIQKGNISWNCGTKKELDKRLRTIDDLYHKIITNGYKSSKEIHMGQYPYPVYDPFQREDEVLVNIGREGDFFFNDGRHRLSIAKILKIPKIPLKVGARHPEWMKFRTELLEFARTSQGSQGKLYQPLNHPDLQDIPSLYGSFRFDLIRKNTFINKGTVLDIGAHLGYFCQRFEEEGFYCYAVEHDPTAIYFLKKLKKIEKKKFEIISKSIVLQPQNLLSIKSIVRSHSLVGKWCGEADAGEQIQAKNQGLTRAEYSCIRLLLKDL